MCVAVPAAAATCSSLLLLARQQSLSALHRHSATACLGFTLVCAPCRSSQVNATAVQVVAGQTAALALKKVKRNQVRKGMVLVDERAKPKASWEFDADIAILTHSTTIQPRYQVKSCPLAA